MKRRVHKSAHMYRRIVWGKKDDPTIIYKCALSGCSHYLHKALVEGAISLCNRCREEVIVINKVMISKNLVKIHCPGCTRQTWNRRKETGPSVRDIQSKLDKILDLGG